MHGYTNHYQDGRCLSYDLNILWDHIKRHSVRGVILVFHESEAFPGFLLKELIEVFRYVRAFLPFHIQYSRVFLLMVLRKVAREHYKICLNSGVKPCNALPLG